MYQDSLNIKNKIITDSDLEEIFLKMNEKIKYYQQIYEKEKNDNEKYKREYQQWTVKDFSGSLKFTVDFYDRTTINFNSYGEFINIFNNRLREMKIIWVYFEIQYWAVDGSHDNLVSQRINMCIQEDKMSIDVKLDSSDNKINDVYELIKDKILNAPEKYDRVIKKKSFITYKITFALGAIPSIIICTILMFFPIIRQIYLESYILYPIATVILSFLVGGTFFGGKLDKLYSPIVPDKKYAYYDTSSHQSVYKDDVDSFIETSEIIIGKNIDNVRNRKEILSLEEKYSKYIPIELVIILILSAIIILFKTLF